MGIVFRIILIVFVSCFAYQAMAQERPLVHRINGKKYYLHVVEPGNTLYGISRTYEVSIGDIQASNSEALVEGLKVNQTLLIPVTSDNRKSLPEVVQDENVIVHTVQPGQTLYSISQEYNCTLDDLLEANPLVEESGLQVNAEIRIPTEKISVESILVEPAAADSLTGHKVEPGETLYGIIVKYETDLPAMAQANPGLTSDLRVGSVLRIPGTSVKPIESTDNDTVISIVQAHIPDSAGVFRIGLLLPLNPHFPDSSNKHDFRIDPVSRIALNYYRGFQYAIDSLDSMYNTQLHIHVYSASNDSGSLNQVFMDPYFDSLDLVVGPFYTSQFETTADRLLQKGVLNMCPINKPSKILFKRPNTIKTTSSESMQINALAEFAAVELSDSNLILVNSNKFQDTQNIEFFKDRFAQSMGVPDTFIEDAITEIEFWKITNEALRIRFPDSGDYVLIVPSKDQVFVTKFLAGLYELTIRTKGSYRFVIYGLNDWRKWEEGLDVKQLHRLNVTLPLANHVDFADYKVSKFYANYFKEFGYEPTDFTVQGFDHASYLFQVLSESPKRWFVSPEEFQFNGVGANYNYRRVLEDSGIENQSVRFYEYDQYRLKFIGEWPSTKTK
jgi:LysM repeat protein